MSSQQKEMPTLKTGIIYHPDFIKHITPSGHPESPMRYTSIETALRSSPLGKHVEWFKAAACKKDALLLCHDEKYIDTVETEVETCKNSLLIKLRMLSTGDVTICKDSYKIAELAVGALLLGCDLIMQNKLDNAFCIVRPPGHHACSDRGMGFCLFNNVAIAARYLQNTYNIKRVLIVDWDVHHGNGTQEIFDNDPSVFYFSTHQEGIYPGTGMHGDIGKGAAIHTKQNCPIPEAEGSRESIIHAFKHVLVPAMKDFRPEFVLISCGFDAHEDDPLGGLKLKSEDFAILTHLVKDIAKTYANGRLVSCLEGGYNLNAIAESSIQHVQALLNS